MATAYPHSLDLNTSINVRNDDIGVTLYQGAEGTMIQELTGNGGRNLLRRPSALWSVEMIDRELRRVPLCVRGIMPRIVQDENMCRLHWDHIPLGGADSAVGVAVSIRYGDTSVLEWQLEVTGVPADWAVARVWFPSLDLAAEDSRSCQLTVPVDAGVSYPNPLRTMPSGGIHEKLRRRPYPHGGFTMQFFALQHEQELLYIAAHDPTPVTKTLFLEPSIDDRLIRFSGWVEAALSFGKDYRPNYPWVMRVMRGDWYDAAQTYRRFAIGASWTSKGPLSAGRKTPSWYQRTGMVGLRLQRGPGFDAEDLLADRAYLGLPFISHYYMWHRAAFDNDYPFIFPAMPDFRETRKRLVEAGVTVMPYFNPYSADMNTPLWDQGLSQLACRINEHNEIHAHTWSQNRRFGAMCPTADLWRQMVRQPALRLLEADARAIYFDEIATSPPHPCFDRRHGHPLGGGETFVTGFRQWVASLRDEAQAWIDDLVVTTEGAADAYIDQFDAFLIGNGNSPYGIPLHSAVYHDYVMGFGRYTFTVELSNPAFEGAIESKHAQQFSWGYQFGWTRVPFSAIRQQAPRTAEFLRHLAHTWHHNADFLATGKMLRPLDLSEQVAPITRRWARSWSDETGECVNLLPVLNGVWQRSDGSIAFVLINITDAPIDLFIKLPSVQDILKALGAEDQPVEMNGMIQSRLYPLPQSCVAQQRIVEGDCLVTSIAQGDTDSGYRVCVPPFKVVTLVIGSEKSADVHES